MSETKTDRRQGAGARESGEGASWPRRAAEVLVQSVKDLLTDSGAQWAAAIAYYSLLSAFPLLLAAISAATVFVDRQWAIDQATRMLGAFVPQGAGQIGAIVEEAFAERNSVGALSFAALLWSGSRVFGVVTQALNIAYDADETYGFWKRTLIEAIMVVTIGLLFVLALAARPLLGLLWNVLGVLPAGQGFAFEAIKALVPAALLLVAFFLIYRFVPRTTQDWGHLASSPVSAGQAGGGLGGSVGSVISSMFLPD